MNEDDVDPLECVSAMTCRFEDSILGLLGLQPTETTLEINSLVSRAASVFGMLAALLLS